MAYIKPTIVTFLGDMEHQLQPGDHLLCNRKHLVTVESLEDAQKLEVEIGAKGIWFEARRDHRRASWLAPISVDEFVRQVRAGLEI